MGRECRLGVLINRRKRSVEFQGSSSRKQWTRKECIDTMTEVINASPFSVLIVDALDECPLDERADLITALEEIIASSMGLIKVFISSRDDVDIVAAMVAASDVKIRADENAKDITEFIHLKVADFEKYWTRIRGTMSQDLCSCITRKLVEGAQGM